MSTRVKCLHCDHMILEVTARLNEGLCGHCHARASSASWRANRDKLVKGWLADPKTLPGTNGIPLPNEIGLAQAANEIRTRLFPTDADKKENFCAHFFNAAHNQWMARGSSSLSDKQKHSLAVETFHGEVCNGGLMQYLTNESGAFANWAADGFDAIGIPQYADIMRKVQALFHGGVIPEDTDVIFDLLDTLSEKVLEGIEQPFWDRYFSNEKEIPDKLYKYLTGK
jgi:hypothetical protein